MAKSKQVRARGKIKLSDYFQHIKEGSLVSVQRDLGINASFPERIQGRSGKVIGTRGDAKLVEMMDGGKRKIFIIHPVHLRRL